MECKESGFAILFQISCHYICHLPEGEGVIFLQQKCYYIGQNEEGVVGKLGIDYIQ